MDSSSAAAEMVTLCAASGYAVHFFPTGQGNVIGNPVLPVIKLCANPRTVRLMPEHIDVDVSGITRKEINMDQAGDKLLEMMFRTANGRLTAAESARTSRVRPHALVRERLMNRLILPLMLCTQLALAAEVAGVKVDERVKLGSSELQLNGARIRTRLFFKVYVGALYLPERKSSATEVARAERSEARIVTLTRSQPHSPIAPQRPASSARLWLE